VRNTAQKFISWRGMDEVSRITIVMDAEGVFPHFEEQFTILGKELIELENCLSSVRNL
jgi:hypothetical protein